MRLHSRFDSLVRRLFRVSGSEWVAKAIVQLQQFVFDRGAVERNIPPYVTPGVVPLLL
jgi:hypothetical protein